jgi:hypothetical protein
MILTPMHQSCTDCIHILPDNCRLSFPAASPPTVWAAGRLWLQYYGEGANRKWLPIVVR